MEVTAEIAAIKTILPWSDYTFNTTADECCNLSYKNSTKKNTTTISFHCGYELVCPVSKKDANFTGWGKQSFGPEGTVVEMHGAEESLVMDF